MRTTLTITSMVAAIQTLIEKEPNKNSKSGIKGILQDRCGSWYAKLTFKGVTYRIRCDSQIEAIYKRKELELEYVDPYLKENEKKIEKKMKGKK